MDFSPIKEAEQFLLDSDIQVNHISDTRKYWFVRTEGGEYYEDFTLNDYIAIGWNDVPFVLQSEQTEALLKKVSELGHGQPRRVLNQVYRFYKEMHKDDIVVIPSEASHIFAFGYLTDDDVYEINDNSPETINCPFTRRRKINWVAGVPRSRIDSKLFSFFRNQQAISDAQEYAEYIERAINTLYIKNGIAHFTLSVDSQNSPRALDIPYFMNGLLSRVADLAKDLHVTDKDDFAEDELSVRINVQSPGVIEFLGDPVFVLLCSVVLIALFGGKLKVKHNPKETSGELSTDGLAGFVLKVLDKYKNIRNMSDVKMLEIQKRMDIQNPSKKSK